MLLIFNEILFINDAFKNVINIIFLKKCNHLKILPVNGACELKLKLKVMINNAIKRAEYKLEQHRSLGTKSPLSVIEVAQLMDIIKRGEAMKNSPSESLFFSFSVN